jgi:hypothetical protein
MIKGDASEFLDGVRLARANHVVTRLILLQHEPHGSHVVSCESPITLGLEIAESQFLVEAELDPCRGLCDLSGYEVVTSSRRFVIEKDA